VGALWFHANYVDPSWSRIFERGPKIGLHIFYTRPGEGAPVQAGSQLAQTP
jgi:spore germination cell wall hydrolase CwlJ-like protein